jgi:YegS/Rv2252/BmrU family lipid kinase
MKQRPAWLVVLNPQSGQRRAGKLWMRLATQLERCNVCFQVRETQGPGDATRLTRMGWDEGFRHFLAVGGDGTVNEVLNGLNAVVISGATTLPVLAVLPAGTGNDWARVLGLPKHPRALAATLAEALQGKTREQDVGELTFPDGRVHLFVEEAGAGFDAHVLQRLSRKGPRALAYVLALLRSISSYRAPKLTLQPDGASEPLVVPSAFLALGANGQWTGGGMRIAPHAAHDDGWLDFVTVRSLGWFELLRKLPKLFNGRLLEDEAVRWCRASGAKLTLDPPGGVQADGQIVGVTPVRFGLRPRALQVPLPGSSQ